MSELTQELGDQVTFTIVPPQETARAADDLDRYLLSSRGHGLVAFTATGEAVVAIAGHQFGREEILMAVHQVAAP